MPSSYRSPPRSESPRSGVRFANFRTRTTGEVMGTATLTAPEQVTDTFPINGTDFIEFYVGNAKQAAHFYRNVFGYKILGYRGPETGTRDRASYILEQGKVRLLLTTALRPDSEIATHVQARRRRQGYRALGGRCAEGVQAG